MRTGTRTLLVAALSMLATASIIATSQPLQAAGGEEHSRSKIVIPSGTTVYLRTNDTIDAKAARDGDKYSAVVNRDVIDENGDVAIPKGSDAELIVEKESNNKMALDLRSITVNGKRYRVTGSTNETRTGKEGIGMNRRTAKNVGGGALIGTVIGAIAGGGKGAAIGLLAGGAAGGVFQQATKGKNGHIPAETVIHFRLDQPLTLNAS